MNDEWRRILKWSSPVLRRYPELPRMKSNPQKALVKYSLSRGLNLARNSHQPLATSEFCTQVAKLFMQ